MSVRRMAALSWALCVALAIAGTVLLLLGPGRYIRGDLFGGVGGLSFLALAFAFATVGAMVASRVPGNRIGWVFCVTGLVTAAGILAYGYANHGLYVSSGRLPGTDAAAVFFNAESEITAPLLGLSLLLFPDGRLPSPRWRPVAFALLLSVALMGLSAFLRPGPLDAPFATVSNPVGIPGTRTVMDLAGMAAWLLVVAGVGLAAASTLVRLRRSHGVERQQLKLVLAVGAVVALVTTSDMVSWLVSPEGSERLRIAAIGVSFAAFPVAAGVAILRYRLYDIDVVIKRTLVYGSLTATLAAAYLGSVLLLQLALDPVTSGSSLAVAVSTLAVAALFRPARARIQGVVDRRFYRRSYDAARTLERFSSRLREQVDLEALGGELRSVVAETMQPAHVSLWLRTPGVRR
jgi:hypothetical protein